MNFNYIKHTIFLALAGSRSYGTNRPDSDYDYRGVIIPPSSYAKGFLHSFEQKEGLDGYGEDSVAYDIRKFCKLAADCNPNIIETLFVPDKFVVLNTKYGRELRKNAHLFLSKKAKHTFSGYAFAQLKKIKRHKSWWDRELQGDVPAKPVRTNFGLPSKPKFGKDVLNNIVTIPLDTIDPALQDYVSAERKYHAEKTRYDNWKKWKQNRNINRYKTEVEFGFDVKHALHLVRLMTMCQEILSEGRVIVHRPDAEFLKSILNGAFTYEELVSWSELKEIELEKLYEKSCLPHKPDLKKINDICVELIEQAEKDGFGK